MRNWKHFVGLLALLTAYAVSVSSQTALTSLRGAVTDPSGGVVPNVRVALDNKATGAHMTRTTDSSGEYSFLQIPPGQYTVTVTMTGFGTQSKGAELLVNQPATINFALSVQESKTTVEVSTEAQTINATDATIGNSVSNTTVQALPMEGRNVPDLLSLQPGVLYLGQKFNNISSANRDTDSRSGAVSGARSDQSNVTLDGVDNNDQRQGYAFTGVLRSTLDSLEEFRVTTTDANAESGRSSGAQVVLVTKSGTNQLHGSIYEYNRTNFGHANDIFNKTAQLQAGLPNKAAPLIRNTFGGSLGGPIKHDRLFYFLNYEGQRTAENKQIFQTVPTQSFRDGNLKYIDTAGNVVTLCSSMSVSNGKCPNASPKDDLGSMDPNCSSKGTCPWGPGADPNSLATFNSYPLPNAPGGDGLNTGGLTFSAPNPANLNTYIAKIDYEMSDHSRFFIRGIQQGDRISASPQFSGQPPNSEIIDTSKGLAAGHLWTIRQNLINNFRYGYIRQGLNVAGAGTASYSDFAGLSPLTAENRNTFLNVPVHNFLDDVNWIKGKHTLQFGVNWRIIHNNTASNAVSFDSATSGAGNISQAAIAGTFQSFDPEAFPNGAAPCNQQTGAGCYPAVGGCFGTDADFDGPPYHRTWPGSLADRKEDARRNPEPILFTSPLIKGKTNYSRVAFEADLPRIELDTIPPCIRSTGVNCVNPPAGAEFYPIYTTRGERDDDGDRSSNSDRSRQDDDRSGDGDRNRDDDDRALGDCVWQFGGASIPGTRNTFGGTSTTEYGPLLQLTYPGANFTPFTRFNNFRRVLDTSPLVYRRTFRRIGA